MMNFRTEFHLDNDSIIIQFACVYAGIFAKNCIGEQRQRWQSSFLWDTRDDFLYHIRYGMYVFQLH